MIIIENAESIDIELIKEVLTFLGWSDCGYYFDNATCEQYLKENFQILLPLDKTVPLFEDYIAEAIEMIAFADGLNFKLKFHHISRFKKFLVLENVNDQLKQIISK